MRTKSILSQTFKLLVHYALLCSFAVCARFAFAMLTVNGLLPTVTYRDINQSIFFSLAGSLLESCIFVLLLFLPLSRMFRYQTNGAFYLKLFGCILFHYLNSCAVLVGKSDFIYQNFHERNSVVVLFVFAIAILAPIAYWFILPLILKNIFSVSAFSLKKMIVPYLMMFALEFFVLIIKEVLGLQNLIGVSLQLSFGYLEMLYLTVAFCVCANAPLRRSL